MPQPRPERTIYRSARGAPGAPRAGTSGLRWFVAPLIALVALVLVVFIPAFFVMGGFSLLSYVGVTRGQDFAGTWAGDQALLGATVLHIGKTGGASSAYTIGGLHVTGGVVSAHKQDDALVATGSSGAGAWRLQLSFIDREQLLARLTFSGGRPAQELRFTRQ